MLAAVDVPGRGDDGSVYRRARMASERSIRWLAWVVVSTAACGGAPKPAEPAEASGPAPLGRRADLPDDCAEVPGKPPPKPLARQYTGVAAKARCQREVYTIMGGLTHFLGVKCAYCHDERDYSIMTHRKHVANWMARELVPALAKKGGGETWCNDCHVVAGKGLAKILGDPRDPRWAIEWMTTHLVDSLEPVDGRPLLCKDCHSGNVGSAGFQKKLILSELPLGHSGRGSHQAEAGAGAEATPEVSTPAPLDSASDAGTLDSGPP